MYDHVLAVGGTGMLAQATSELASRARTITVLARRPERWSPPADLPVAVVPLALDLQDADAVEQGVRSSIERHGALREAILWMHEDVPESLTRLVALIAETSPSARVVRVAGSINGAPDRDREARRAELLEAASAPDLDLRVAILGWQPDDDGGTRWLNHDEISAGALAALEDGSAAVSVVGRLEPWEQRPGT